MSFILLGILNSQAAGAGGAGTYELLESEILASDASSVTFTGLDSFTDFKHLQIRAVLRSDRTANLQPVQMTFNSDTGLKYSDHVLRGTGSSILSQNDITNSDVQIAITSDDSDEANNFGAFVMDILDFSSTSKNTTIRTLGGKASASFPTVGLFSGFFDDTSAITELNIFPVAASNWKAGSRFSLYGIRA